ncbi:MAG: metallophosphoesterase [Acidobacteriota bacterium]|nr:metallophosphoesterase [Blastocatellia bacterium]MDW8239398.1 metallophosphoesterase [Acidobacteriota bacterium]
MNMFSAMGALLCGAIVVYAVWIEPYWIEVTHHRISAPLSSPLKLVHLSDIHARDVGRRERRLVEILRAEKPDIIVITGDTVIRGYTPEGLSRVLEQFDAPLGIWFVFGNWEHWEGAPMNPSFYEAAGVRLLLNRGQLVRGDVWLAGFDDLSAGRPNMQAALNGRPADVFTIALFHSPAYFDQVAGQCHLALAGHTHGGQVRLPLLPPLWLPPGCGPYAEGWYERNGSRLYVSRGVGTAVVNVRFFCRPEVAVITIGPTP